MSTPAFFAGLLSPNPFTRCVLCHRKRPEVKRSSPSANASSRVQLLIILCQHPTVIPAQAGIQEDNGDADLVGTVIPAQAGIQSFLEASPLYEFWIPACAGMTVGEPAPFSEII